MTTAQDIKARQEARDAREAETKKQLAEEEAARKEIAALPNWQQQQDWIMGAQSRATASILQAIGDTHGKPITEKRYNDVRATFDLLGFLRCEHDRLDALAGGNPLLKTAQAMYGKK